MAALSLQGGPDEQRPQELHLDRELAAVRRGYNGVRLHAGIGYVTPDDEHTGRGAAIRHARRLGLARARQARLAYHRNHNNRPPS